MTKIKLDALAEKANNLPLLPGVYIMYDSNDTVIYVGKAKKLKNRVTSYFHGEHLPKVEAMVDKVDHFNVIVCGSEFEALVLENSLIKQHMPHYNILLKDDKGYPFIAVNMHDEYPKLSLRARADDKTLTYFGPFGTRGQTYDIIESVQKALKLPTCSKVFPRDIGKDRPCINYQIGQCAGWCRSAADKEEYLSAIEQAKQILSGSTSELTDTLQKQMEHCAENLLFEKAAELRDKIRSIERLSIKQRVLATAFSDTDAIGFFRDNRTCFTVLHFLNGNLVGKDVVSAEYALGDDSEIVSEFVCSYYSKHRGGWPKSIVLPVEIDHCEDMERMLSQLSGRRIYLTFPKKGEKHKLAESAMLNAEEESKRMHTAEQRRHKTLEWLRDNLGLDSIPLRIEAYDISNLGNTGIVAGMSVFVNGKPSKKDYRRFRLTELREQNDYESMYTTILRRFTHVVENDTKFGASPDLVLIDGGAEHAAKAEEALREMGLSYPVFGMVKDDRHRTRALITSGGHEIGIAANQSVFSLIGNIQEETHNHAIDYQRKLRSEAFESELVSIPNVGKRRAADLMKAFKSSNAIKNASIEQLKLVVPGNAARNIFEYYHKTGRNDL